MASLSETRKGVVFSARHGEPGQNPTDYEIGTQIGTFEEQPNGDIRVSLERLPWGGGWLLMRPDKTEDQAQ